MPSYKGERVYSKETSYPKLYRNTEKLKLGGKGPFLEYPIVRDLYPTDVYNERVWLRQEPVAILQSVCPWDIPVFSGKNFLFRHIHTRL
jgi:hypothetical protein